MLARLGMSCRPVGNVDGIGGIQLHRLRIQIDGRREILLAEFRIALRLDLFCLLLVRFRDGLFARRLPACQLHVLRRRAKRVSKPYLGRGGRLLLCSQVNVKNRGQIGRFWAVLGLIGWILQIDIKDVLKDANRL